MVPPYIGLLLSRNLLFILTFPFNRFASTILFTWIKKIDEGAMKIQICTISFPSYHYLRLGVLNRRQKGKEMADNLKGTYMID